MKDLMAKLMVLIMDQYEQYKRKSRAKALTQQTPEIPKPATDWSRYDTPTVIRRGAANRAFLL